MTEAFNLIDAPAPDWTVASPWLDLWSGTTRGTPRLINLSENATHLVEGGAAGRVVLRLHRPGYQARSAIESELAWLAALRRDTTIPLPEPLPGRDGQLVQQLDAARFGVLFAYLPGREPSAADDLGDLFAVLGRYAALAHAQSRNYVPPPGFARQLWSAGAVLDADGLWGDWRAAPGVVPFRPVLDALDRRLRADLAAYGTGPDRFGLVHADMRLANLLVDGQRVALIDFDDCGFCWFMYDFAAAISFHEDDPRVPDWRARWIAGYGEVSPLADADIAILDTMVLLRRMALLAWIGSHAETPLARAHAADFARVTASLAMPYLSR